MKPKQKHEDLQSVHGKKLPTILVDRFCGACGYYYGFIDEEYVICIQGHLWVNCTNSMCGSTFIKKDYVDPKCWEDESKNYFPLTREQEEFLAKHGLS